MFVFFERPVPNLYFLLAFLALPLVLGGQSRPAPAQTIEVRNGGTVTVENGGVWDLDGTTVDLGPAGSTARIAESGGGRFAGGPLTAVRALSRPSSADPAGLGIEISASKNLGDVTVTRGHGVQTAPNGNESIERYYEVSPSQNNSGLSATLTFSYTDDELNGRTESTLAFFKSSDGGSTWSEEGYDSRDASANTVTLGGITSFSRWTLGSTDNPLPVELVSFEGRSIGDGVRLVWRTASETGNSGFAVQRKIDPGTGTHSWQKVGFVDSQAEGGTSTQAHTYRLTDTDLPYAADSMRYRLRQVDVDGSTQLSDPVTVARSRVQRAELRETFPNPARRQVTVRYAVPDRSRPGDVTLRLYDTLGRQVRSMTVAAEAGRHEVQLDVQDLASGVYFLRLQGGDTVRARRLTVVQ
ncbi:MAG: T9SS type A sorting domain-containing protein [Salinivenus sp.]